jgi:hypothetical protein
MEGLAGRARAGEKGLLDGAQIEIEWWHGLYWTGNMRVA